MLDANHAAALADLGALYLQTNKLSEGEACLKKSLLINPNQALVLNNLGTVYSNAHQFEDAVAYYAKAVELNPNYADAFSNLGLNQYSLSQFSEAEQSFNKALSLSPHFVRLNLNLGLLKLLLGDFEAGLPLYEWRWHADETKNKIRQFNKPLWLGAESIAGKTSSYTPNKGLAILYIFADMPLIWTKWVPTSF